MSYIKNLLGEVRPEKAETKSAKPVPNDYEEVEEPEEQPVDNQRIVRRFYLPGQTYSMNKAKIKEILKKHWLKWAGSLDWPQWKNEKAGLTVRADFERENGVTRGCTLIYEGTAVNKFIVEFTYYIEKIGGQTADDEALEPARVPDEELNQTVAEELAMWDMFNRPDVERMRKPSNVGLHSGAPERLIEMAVDDWKRRRADKEAEIRKRIQETGE